MLTKTVIDFFLETDHIESGKKPIQSSNLYRFLQPVYQTKLDNFHSQNVKISYLKQIYRYEEYEVTSFFLQNVWKFFYFNYKTNILDKEQKCKDAYLAKQNRQWFQYDTMYTLEVGLYPFIISFVLNKYHKEFELPEYLSVFVYEESDLAENTTLMTLNLMISRMNYILHGRYLPIVLTYTTFDHATTTVYLPRLTQLDVCFWHVIPINSNGDGIENMMELTTGAFENYKDYLSSQQKNKFTIITSNCNQDIQKNYGTCASWSLFLALHFLSDYDIYVSKAFQRHPDTEPETSLQFQRTSDAIDEFCQNLAEHNATKTFAMKKYNEVISDFEAANFCSQVEMDKHLQQMGKPQSWESMLSMIFDDHDGSVFKHLKLFTTIFSTMKQMRDRVIKNAFDDFDEPRTISDEIRQGQKLVDEFTYKLQQTANIFGKNEITEEKIAPDDDDDVDVEADFEQKMLVEKQVLIEEKEHELDRLRGIEKRKIKITLLPMKTQSRNVDIVIDNLEGEIIVLKRKFAKNWNNLKSMFSSDQDGLASMHEFQEKWFEIWTAERLQEFLEDIDNLEKQIRIEDQKNKYNQFILLDNPDEATIELVREKISQTNNKKEDLKLKKRNKIRGYEELLAKSKTLFQRYKDFESRILLNPIVRRVRYASDGDGGGGQPSVSKRQKHESAVGVNGDDDVDAD